VDVVIPAGIHIGTHWFVALPVAWWLCFKAGLGPTGVWWGYCAGIVLSGIFLLLRGRTTIGALARRGFPTRRDTLPAVEPVPPMGLEQ
jgi:MATE family multidrug resistance protein